MTNIIRVTKVKVSNLKNVKQGSFCMNSNFGELKKSDIIGMYGQNGSGKTAIVEAYSLLKTLLSGESRQLPNVTEHLVYYNKKSIEIVFDLIIKNSYGEYFIEYYVSLIPSGKKIIVSNEKISYRENQKNKRFKVLVSKEQQNISIRNNKVDSLEEDVRVSVMVANQMADKNSTSFVFREELADVYQQILNDTELEIIRNLIIDFNRDFHVIDALNYGYLVADIMMPFSIHLENKRGEFPYDMREPMTLPIDVFETIEKVIEQTNIVLQHIIPDLTIRIDKLYKQKMEDGQEGVRFEFLSRKGDIELPLRSESAGTLKIISILSTLIAVYNNPNALVVIDELDAGIFEYLLGELLEVISENGKGQLFFTSHNLRILEVLPKNNLWFTTANENNRFIQLKGIKKLSNARDIYLRAVQLGGQDESIYIETDAYDIKTSFRKAGILND